VSKYIKLKVNSWDTSYSNQQAFDTRLLINIEPSLNRRDRIVGLILEVDDDDNRLDDHPTITINRLNQNTKP